MSAQFNSAHQRQIDAQSPAEPQDGPDLDTVMEAVKDANLRDELNEWAIYAVEHNDFHWLQRKYAQNVAPLLERAQ